MLVLEPDGLSSQVEQTCQGTDDALRHQSGCLLIGQLRQQHGKFVTADAGQRVAVPNAMLEPLAGDLQCDVTHLMTKRVIDRLEAIEVHHEDGKCRAMAARVPHGPMQAIGEQRTVRQAGQRIGVCKIDELHTGAMLPGRIPGEGDNRWLAADFDALQVQLNLECRSVASPANAPIVGRGVFGGSE